MAAADMTNVVGHLGCCDGKESIWMIMASFYVPVDGHDRRGKLKHISKRAPPTEYTSQCKSHWHLSTIRPPKRAGGGK